MCSTPAYALLFLLLSTAMSSGRANFTSLLVTAIVNTAANRRFTFGVDGPRDALRHQLQGLVIFAIGLAVTSGSLAALHALGSTHRGAEVVVLTTANLSVTVLRFVAMKLGCSPSALALPRAAARRSPGSWQRRSRRSAPGNRPDGEQVVGRTLHHGRVELLLVAEAVVEQPREMPASSANVSMDRSSSDLVANSRTPSSSSCWRRLSGVTRVRVELT